MELKTWVRLEAGRSARLAEHLTSVVRTVYPEKQINRAQVTSWISDESLDSWRPIPAYLAPAIEEYTKRHSRPEEIPGDGPVMRWDSCPKDWRLYWPEIYAAMMREVSAEPVAA